MNKLILLTLIFLALSLSVVKSVDIEITQTDMDDCMSSGNSYHLASNNYYYLTGDISFSGYNCISYYSGINCITLHLI